MAITTPEYRQFTRQTYIASTERDGGLSHLWHMNRLAHIRLDPSPGIEGYREVDFRHPEAMSDTQARHVDNLMGRHDRLVKAKERELVAENKTILNRLLLCESDSHRLASHHNLFPSKEEMAKYDKLDDQLFFKQRDREEKFKKMDKENKVLLRHLVEVQPGVRTAKELDAWYHNVHKKRVQTLSRFKPIEPFAGANILRRECSVRFPNERRGSKWALLVEPPDAFRPPLVCGRPHPPIPISEAALSAPESIQPSTTTPVGTTNSKRAPWQGIAKNDIPLMHYASDLSLVHDVEFVTPPQESGCTRMWRDAIRSAREKYSNRKRKELQAVSSRSPDSQLNAAAMNDSVTRRYSQRWGSSTEDGTPRTKGDFDTRHLGNETSPNQQRMMDAGAHFLHHSSPGSDKHPTESPGETSGWNSEFNRPLPSSQQSPSELRQFTQRSHSRSMTSNRDVAAGRRGLSTQQSAQGPPSSESRTNGGSLFHPSVPREGNVECGAFGQSGHSSRAAGSSIRQYTAEDAVAVPGHRSPDTMENQRPSQRGLSKTFSAGSGKRNFASPTEAATASDPFEAMMAEWNRASRKSSAGVKYIPL